VKKPAWATRSALTSLAKRKSVWAGTGGVAGIAIGVAAGVLLIAPGQPLRPAPAAPGATPSAGLTPPQAAPNLGKGFRVIVPSIGTNAPVIPVGATAAGGGTLSVPSSVHVVGWWDGLLSSSTGPSVQEKVASPGQSGVALLAGHIDSAFQGKGVFSKLQQIKPGAEITVIDAKQKVTHWKVTRVQTMFKTDLPPALFASTGAPQLALVSCGGPFDDGTGHYLDNVIAWAKET
jgi:hypothetical protein